MLPRRWPPWLALPARSTSKAKDFKNEDFFRLLTNAVFWAAKTEPEKMKK